MQSAGSVQEGGVPAIGSAGSVQEGGFLQGFLHIALAGTHSGKVGKGGSCKCRKVFLQFSNFCYKGRTGSKMGDSYP